MDITISFNQHEFKASLNNSKTAVALYKKLPFSETISCWGGEIYFPVNLILPLEETASPSMKDGDIAYWPGLGGVVCVFFGKTPASKGENPEAAAPVNLIGKVEGNIKKFYELTAGEKVVFAAIKDKS